MRAQPALVGFPPPLSKSELTGRWWVVRFNPLLLMSGLISINLQPADQTGLLLLLLLASAAERATERERDSASKLL